MGEVNDPVKGGYKGTGSIPWKAFTRKLEHGYIVTYYIVST